jgi:hypothetical protein
LVDKAGRVRHVHFGEGDYSGTESAIRALLGERVQITRTSVADRTPQQPTTPESYLGYERLDRFASGNLAPDVEVAYRFPRSLAQDHLAYAGRWAVEPSRIVAGDDAKVRLRFQANDVYLVLGGSGRVDVLVDGRPSGSVSVAGTPRLYTIGRFPTLTHGLLELRFSRGVEAYAFTFG